MRGMREEDEEEEEEGGEEEGEKHAYCWPLTVEGCSWLSLQSRTHAYIEPNTF